MIRSLEISNFFIPLSILVDIREVKENKEMCLSRMTVFVKSFNYPTTNSQHLLSVRFIFYNLFRCAFYVFRYKVLMPIECVECDMLFKYPSSTILSFPFDYSQNEISTSKFQRV